jgi:heme oxygenase
LHGHAHTRLRAETRNLYRYFDARLVASALREGDGYVRFLLMSWPCAPIEVGLDEAGVDRVLPDWHLRQRRFALVDDLEALDVAPPASDPYPIAADIGTMLGWNYALEGARLGANLIFPSIAINADPVIRGATRFLRHGDGHDLWPRFKIALAQIDHDPIAIGKACDAAKTAFRCFIAGSIPQRVH